MTGLPRRASAVSIIDATRKFVQETNTPSQSSRSPIFSIASRIDSGSIRPTTKSSDSKKDPVTGISKPETRRLSRIVVVIPGSYGVRKATRLTPSACKAALQAVKGFEVGTSGCTTWIAFSTFFSPIIVEPEVQP